MFSNRERIEAAFADMRNRGIIARTDFWCCNSCASSSLMSREVPFYREKNGPEDQPVGYVFFHEQSTDAANEGSPLYLSHGSISEASDSADSEQVQHDQRLVAQMVMEVLREHDFDVQWDGNTFSTIEVLKPSDGWNLDYDREEDDYDEDDED